MAMKSVVFKRPVKLGKQIYPKSPKAQQVDEKFLQQRLMKAYIKSGDVAVVEAAPAPAAAKPAAAKPAPAAKE